MRLSGETVREKIGARTKLKKDRILKTSKKFAGGLKQIGIDGILSAWEMYTNVIDKLDDSLKLALENSKVDLFLPNIFHNYTAFSYGYNNHTRFMV